MSAPLPIAVLVSGTGTNLQALLDTVHGSEARSSPSPSTPPMRRRWSARASRDVPTAAFRRADYADRAARDDALGRVGRGPGARLVVLAGYMELLGERFLDRFPGPSSTSTRRCCPPSPGLHAIEQALDYGVKVFGVTVHFVDAGVDSGPVILQRAIELRRPASPMRCWRRCVRSSTRCCRRRCACSRRARFRRTRRTRGGSFRATTGYDCRRRCIGSPMASESNVMTR